MDSTVIIVYDALQLMHPKANIHQLSNMLHSKKDKLEKLTKMPSFQRTPFGVYCQDLADYRTKLWTAVGDGDSIRKKYFSGKVSEALALDHERTNQLCNIFDFSPEEFAL